MKQQISLEESIVLWLNELENKVAFTDADLLFFLHKIQAEKTYNGFKIVKLRSTTKLSTLLYKAISFLEENNFIKLTRYPYYILRNKQYTPYSLICSVYPYGYLSYSSALDIYRLIEEQPKSIDFVIPPRKDWNELEKEQIVSLTQEDNILNKNFYHSYPSDKLKFERKKVHFHVTKNLFPSNNVTNSIRVIEIGCLFLEMLHHPDKCGGFEKVIKIFDGFGNIYIDEILKAAELFGNNLDKSKIGYIFEERLKTTNIIFQLWKETCLGRGGSRKMIANEPYSSKYSENWCISLNHSIFD